MIPRLHVLVGDREVADRGADRTVARILERLGADVAVHLRTRLPARELYERTAHLARVAERAGGWCVVNGRLDVALAAGAQAVQLGGASIGVAAARRGMRRVVGARSPGGREGPPPLRIGASVHGAEEAGRAVSEGADYLVLGTIFATPSHPARAGAGVGRIAAVRAARRDGPRRPLLAIGGIDVDRVREVVEAGADGIVVYRAVWGEPEPIAAAAALRERIEAARPTREDGNPEGSR